jgi:hypothetical protein
MTIVIPALKDKDGDFWIHHFDGRVVCMNGANGTLDVTLNVEDLDDSIYGPFERTHLSITEVTSDRCPSCVAKAAHA